MENEIIEKDFFCDHCEHQFDSDDGDWRIDDILLCPECGEVVNY